MLRRYSGLLLAFFVAACSGEAGTGSLSRGPNELPSLKPPDRDQMITHPLTLAPDDGPPLSADLYIDWSCEEIARWLGIDLPVLSDPPAKSATPLCALEGPVDGERPEDPSGRDASGQPVTLEAHVLYLPESYDLDHQTYQELINIGMIDLSVSFTPDVENPAPTRDRPDEIAGGYAVFDVRGERGVVQRIAEHRTRTSWWEGTERGRARHTMTSRYEPEDAVRFSRGMDHSRAGPPGAVRDRSQG